jgi:hypothetical protein
MEDGECRDWEVSFVLRFSRTFREGCLALLHRAMESNEYFICTNSQVELTSQKWRDGYAA